MTTDGSLQEWPTEPRDGPDAVPVSPSAERTLLAVNRASFLFFLLLRTPWPLSPLTHINQCGHPDNPHKSTNGPCKTKKHNRMLSQLSTYVASSSARGFPKRRFIFTSSSSLPQSSGPSQLHTPPDPKLDPTTYGELKYSLHSSEAAGWDQNPLLRGRLVVLILESRSLFSRPQR